MGAQHHRTSLYKAIGIPLAGWAAFGLQHALQLPWLHLLLLPLLVACTLQAVHHAEVVAQKVGQPLGTFVLALSVTAIESSLIISMMGASDADGVGLARDTVFAAVMIILNGMIGISLIAGSRRHHEQSFLPEGINAMLTTLVAISVLTLILPNFTETTPGPYYAPSQLLFVAIVSLVLYGVFILVQNFKHKHYFASADTHEEAMVPKPSAGQTALSGLLMLLCLGAVVALAELLAHPLDALLDKWALPHAIAGIIIACIILLPEGLTAYRAAKNNQLQKSLNLSLGSALASIGLTLPIVSIYALATDSQLMLGIGKEPTILFLLSIFLVIMSLRTGKTTILQGAVLFVVFLVYLFLTVVP